MKLIRFGEIENEKPGVIDEQGKRKDVSKYFTDWDRKFFRQGGLPELRQLMKNVAELPEVPETGGCGLRASRYRGKLSASDSIFQTMLPNRGCRFRPNRSFFRKEQTPSLELLIRS